MLVDLMVFILFDPDTKKKKIIINMSSKLHKR